MDYSTTTATATVYDADTGDELPGVPTDELVRESLAAGDTGAVAAYRDERGVWHYVPDCRADFYSRHRGEEVRTVYVMVEDGDEREPSVEIDLDSIEVFEPDLDDDEPDFDDALSYYIGVDVVVSGERVRVGCMVGAPDSYHGSVRAAGAGVRPFCTAWWADASDWQDVPAGAREAVIDALKDASWALFLRAREEVGADRPSC